MLSALKAVVIVYKHTLKNFWLLLASKHWVLFSFGFFSPDIFYKSICTFFPCILGLHGSWFDVCLIVSVPPSKVLVTASV